MPECFDIIDNGREIASTSFWHSAQAARGGCHLSCRPGVLRLLLPRVLEAALDEMRIASGVTIEPSEDDPAGCVEIVFEDGSDTPFAIACARDGIDGTLARGLFVPFTVWTSAGKQLTLRADVLI